MSHLIYRIAVIILAIGVLTMAGCAPTPPPTYFQLEEPANVQLSGIERGIAVGVGPLNLPAYLDRPHIVTRATEHRLELSDFNRWAEPLKDSMLRVIAVNLSNQLETTRVFALPRRIPVVPIEFKVEINVARFDGRLGGEVVLVARWILLGKEDQLISTKVSIIREQSTGSDYDALIKAQNKTLQKLSNEIAEAILTNN
jgi:uncharacterized lipoprotein YmbA